MRTATIIRRIHALGWLFLLGNCYWIVVAQPTWEESRGHDEGEGDNAHIDNNNNHNVGFPFLYASRGNPNASAPIIEYMVVVSKSAKKDTNDDEEDEFSYTTPPFIENTEEYRVVEFYVHWCNVCKDFARQYIKLANTILSELPKDDTPAANHISFHAVSCAVHRSTCQHLAVTKYPALRLYGPGDTVGVDVAHAQIHPTLVMQKLGIQPSDQQQQQQNARLENWNRNHSQLLLGYPIRILDWIRSVLTQLVNRYLGAWMGFQSTNRFEEFPRRNRDEIRNDIHLSFDYGLRQGVFVTDGMLTDERAKILREWFLLLRHTLPASWKVLHQCIESLIDNFDYVRRSERYMVSILDEYAPSVTSWSATCSRGDATNGFSCGLWSLLHAITVGFVDYNRGTAFPETRLSAENVSRTIRDYVDEFFGCEECSRKFVSAYDACAHDRCHRLAPENQKEERDWIELPMWLFEMHNAVNVRLMKDRWAASHGGDDRYAPEISTVFWPPISHCARCWTPQYRQWNGDIMYKFMKLEYGQRDAQAMAFQKEVFAKDPPKDWNKILSEVFDDGTQKLLKTWERFSETLEHYYFKYLIFSQYLPKRKRRRSSEELRINVHLILDMSMRHHVFRGDKSQISVLSRLALQSWLELLNKTLPPSWNTIHVLINEILVTFDHATRDKEYLKSILDTHALDQKTNWTGICSQSADPPLCALWEMLHVVSVGVVFHNQYTANSDNERLSTAEVLDIVKDFLIHLFDCDKCRRRWNEILINCASNSECQMLSEEYGSDVTWKQLPTWLFQIHNEVKLQIFSEKSVLENRVMRDEEISELLWPRMSDCERCWMKPGKWDADVVYEYILHEYGSSFNTFSRDLESNFFSNSYNPYLSAKLSDKFYWMRWLTGVQTTESRKYTPEDIEKRAMYAFHIMIGDGLYVGEHSIPEQRRQVLRAWLELLRKTLPASWSTLSQLVKELLDNISYVTKNKAYMIAVLEEYPIYREADKYCVNLEGNNTFPCGIWDLLFAMAVGFVQHNRDAPNEASRLSSEETAQIVHGAISEFLRCEPCRLSFSSSFESCEGDRCKMLLSKPGTESDWLKFPLWLIMTYNSLQINASKKATTQKMPLLSDDDIYAGRWPPKVDCDRCWLDDDQLDEKVTFKYVEMLYGDGAEVRAKFWEEL